MKSPNDSSLFVGFRQLTHFASSPLTMQAKGKGGDKEGCANNQNELSSC
jgi:hypothetical protein